jgi:hypothetical protein
MNRTLASSHVGYEKEGSQDKLSQVRTSLPHAALIDKKRLRSLDAFRRVLHLQNFDAARLT